MGLPRWVVWQAGLAVGLVAGVADGLIAAAWTRGVLWQTLLAVLVSGTAGALACGVLSVAASWLAGGSRAAGSDAITESTPTSRLLFVAALASTPLLAALVYSTVSTVWSGGGPLWRIGATLLGSTLIFATGIRLLQPLAQRRPLKAALMIIVPTVLVAAAVLALGWLQPAAPREHARTTLDRPPPRNPANVLVIVLDTARADRMSLYGYSRATTPFLADLARESTVYLNAIAPAPWTLPSHASLFTGQYPSFHGATEEHRYLANELNTLAEILRDSGYATAAFSSNSVVSSAHNLDQGFEEFYEIFRLETDLSALEITLPGRLWRRVSRPLPGDKGGRQINQSVKRWLERWERRPGRPPFFLFLNYIEPHLPYGAPPPHGNDFLVPPLLQAPRSLTDDHWMTAIFQLMARPETISPDEYRQIGDLYDGNLAYQDEILSLLYQLLREHHLLDETLLVVVSDHGENLGEHGGLLDHIFSIHQTLLRVPLLIRYPAQFPQGLRYDEPVSTVAIFATILDVLGLDHPPDSPRPIRALPRRSKESFQDCVLAEYHLPLRGLSELAARFPGLDVSAMAVRSTALLLGDWKLVQLSNGEMSLYNLAADAGESSPQDPTSSEIGLVMLQELGRCTSLSPPSRPRSPDPQTELDAEQQKLLRSLGYLH